MSDQSSTEQEQPGQESSTPTTEVNTEGDVQVNQGGDEGSTTTEE